MGKVNWYKLLDKAWKDFYKKKKAKGEDKKLYIEEFEENSTKNLNLITKYLQTKKYNFGEWKAILIKKKDGGERPIIVPYPLRDKILLKALCEYLTNIFSKDFNKVESVSFAYQKGKSSRDALLQLKKMYKSGDVLLKIDIQHFFDEIDKEILLQLLDNYKMDDYVKDLVGKSLRPAVDYAGIQNADLEKFPKGGIPQGNPISNILSNLYLNDFDKLVIEKGWNMVRYADDMVFSLTSEDEARFVLYEVEKYLSMERNLRIHPLGQKSDSKTAIFVNPKKNKMTYLGINFDGINLYLTDECYSKLTSRIEEILKNEDASIDKEQLMLNAIKQWCGYYAFTDVKSNKLKNLNRAINYQIKKYQPSISDIDIEKIMTKIKKKQNSIWYKIGKKIKPEEGNEWLDFYC
ncbi:MAG: hypothetical protein IKA83_04170 [Paludibacteraceae bacterium]|nr:hypothetical protein [Paludibacteraceae bacterium]